MVFEFCKLEEERKQSQNKDPLTSPTVKEEEQGWA
jgi:hypothetical protein